MRECDYRHWRRDPPEPDLHQWLGHRPHLQWEQLSDRPGHHRCHVGGNGSIDHQDDDLGGSDRPGFTPGSTYSLDFFASEPGRSVSGVQAQSYLGTETFTGGTTGNATFTRSRQPLSTSQTVTATATLLAGTTFTDTSTFATAIVVTELSSFVVTTTAATGAGSLEQVILNVNADTSNPNADTVTFEITTGGAPFIISLPSTGLTPIDHPVVLDATSQPGYIGTPIIVLNGTGVSGSGLVLAAGSPGSAILGFDIINFTAANTYGIDIESSGNVVQSNYVGVETNGRRRPRIPTAYSSMARTIRSAARPPAGPT